MNRLDKYLRMISWKDYRGRWDKSEIQVDIIVIVVVAVLIFVNLILFKT